MKELKFKKCMICGTVVEVLEGNGKLICCGQEMTELVPNSVDASFEKHVPTYEVEGNNIRAKVNHVMESDHYIEWIELLADGVSYFAFLNPGDAPEAEFCVKADKVTAREFCNKHGLWKAEFQG